MKRGILTTLALALVCLPMPALVGCDALASLFGGGGTGTGGTNLSGLTAVRTTISVHPQAAIKAGSDVIAFGTGGSTGVSYILPSQADSTARSITDGGNYDSSDLVVAGRNIFLTDNDFQVTVFNVDDLESNTMSVNQIRLKNIPVSQFDVGNIQASGHYCAVICDEDEVDDGHILKVIDTSTDPLPTVIAFTQDPAASAEEVQQVAVDGDTQQVVAVVGGDFYVFNIADPTAEALLIEGPDTGIGDTQMVFDGERVLFHDDSGIPNAMVMNLTGGAITQFAENPASKQLALADGLFAYFLSDDQIGASSRSAIGSLVGLSAATATTTTATVDDFIDGSTTINGAFGFGETNAVVTGLSRWFVAGYESIGSGEYLQTSTGGAFVTVNDPNGEDEFGCPASDVNCSENTVAFKTGTGANTSVGYIALP